MKRRPALWAAVAATLAVLAVLWYLFRPETLFLDRRVDEPFPTVPASP